ncbi:hypothetical protein BCY84_19603 [Trypanosoma cruzi cruzi]|nr:hypothetical protein TcBrA4_0098270 [Trypanosoma cruzi]PBJ69529.1 hypothetical protein BCY84_19603 [Trypanosoma cruzi cruzi]
MPSLSRRPLAIGSEAEEGSSTLINEQEQRQQVCPPGQTPPLVGRSSSHYGGCMSRNDYHSELRNYFYSAGIPTIFDALSTALLQEKPEEPVDFILSWFRRERERVLTNAEEKNMCNSNDGSGSCDDSSKDESGTSPTLSLSETQLPL